MSLIGNHLKKSGDFFGIASLTTKHICGSLSKSKLPRDGIQQKYWPLITRRKALANEINEHNVVFGTVRRDGENLPQFHGQFELSSDKPLFDSIDIKQRFVKDDAEVYEEELLSDGAKVIETLTEKSLADILNEFKEPLAAEELDKYKNKPPLTFEFKTELIGSEPKLSDYKHDEIIIEESSKRQPRQTLVYETEDESEEDELKMEEPIKFEPLEDPQFDAYPGGPPPRTAFDHLKAVRSRRIEPTAKGLKHRLQEENPYPLYPSIRLDSQGSKIYTDQVPNWRKCRRVEIIDYLKRSIIFHNYDILAVNKPYGISSHDEQRGEDSDFDMNTLMQEIATKMKIEKIYLAHRLDKTTTGVLLFATSQTRASHLNKLFKSGQIKKKYSCITVGVPDPPHGIIDIPVGKHVVAGKLRACLAPEKVRAEFQLSKKYVEARRAVTEYKVVNRSKWAALVEVQPRTGVKHQIRCHMGFALNSPILGDHKYSHIGRLAPQQLPTPMLKLLHLRMPKVRTLPTHLHAETVVIPGAKANGETLFISAPLPAHFSANLKTLELKRYEVRK